MENKQIQQAKDTIAKKYGYLNFETIPYNHISSINVRYENYQDIVNEAIIEYHRLMSEWVSVDERDKLPINSSFDTPVLVYGRREYDKNFGVYKAWMLSDNKFYSLQLRGDEDFFVTHHMPLPQPPK